MCLKSSPSTHGNTRGISRRSRSARPASAACTTARTAGWRCGSMRRPSPAAPPSSSSCTSSACPVVTAVPSAVTTCPQPLPAGGWHLVWGSAPAASSACKAAAEPAETAATRGVTATSTPPSPLCGGRPSASTSSPAAISSRTLARSPLAMAVTSGEGACCCACCCDGGCCCCSGCCCCACCTRCTCGACICTAAAGPGGPSARLRFLSCAAGPGPAAGSWSGKTFGVIIAA